MKILVIHQYYLFPGQPGGSRFNEFARLWTSAGHDVTVLAGTVNYATGETPSEYRGKWITEEWDGPVRVLRCHVPSSYSAGYVGRMWAFAGFTFSSITALAKVRDADVVIATSPPLIAAIPGWVASRLRLSRVPWIFEIRDLWPESAVTTGVLSKTSPITKVLYRLERFACEHAEKINVLTPAFRDDLVHRAIANEGKIAFIPNGADIELFSPGPKDNEVRRTHGWGDKFVVMYAGAHGRANAVGQLIEAAEILRDDKRILIASVGDGPERAKLAADAIRRGLTNIRFYGAQPKQMMVDWVNACDVGAAVLQDNPTFRTVYPNKVFDYMACERPTLLAIDGVARQLVCDQAKAGVFAEPENPVALAAAIRKLAESPSECRSMGKAGREWVLANATRDSLAQKYLQLMQEVTAR